MILFLLACSSLSDPVLLGSGQESLVVDARLGGKPSESAGEFVIEVQHLADGSLEIGDPVAQGLNFTFDRQDVERLGTHQVTREHWRFTGSKGSFEIPPLAVALQVNQVKEEAWTTSVFVDLGPSEFGRETLAEIIEPTATVEIPWKTVGFLGGALLLVLGGFVVAFRDVFRSGRSLTRREPPDLVLLRLWDKLQSDETTGDLQRATQLSAAVRTYLEQSLLFEATAMTTSEIVAALEALSSLPSENPARVKRLLRAADMVKFADGVGLAAKFQALDTDLRRLVTDVRAVYDARRSGQGGAVSEP